MGYFLQIGINCCILVVIVEQYLSLVSHPLNLLKNHVHYLVASLLGFS